MRVPQNRKGFSGWKLTKRPQEMQGELSLPDLGLSGTGFVENKAKKVKRYAKDPNMNNPYLLGPDEKNINQTL
jgi:hypothetical protein